MNSVHFNGRKFLITILVFCFVFGSVALDYSPAALSASALSTEEYKELISNLEKDQAEIEAELKDLKNDKSAQNAKKQAILNKQNRTFMHIEQHEVLNKQALNNLKK